MSAKDAIIYAVVGSFLGVVVGGLLILWIVKKCRHKSKQISNVGSVGLMNNNEDKKKKNDVEQQSPTGNSSASGNSMSSKKPLLSYGSTTRSLSTVSFLH